MGIENLPNEQNNGIKEFLKTLFPDAHEFKIYAEPYLLHITVRRDYEKYLVILNKLNIQGIDEIAERLSGIKDAFSENSMDMVKATLEMVGKKYGNGAKFPATLEEFMNDYVEMLPMDKAIPLQSGLSEALYKTYNPEFERIEEKTKDLSKEEQEICEYFDVFLMRLWIRLIMVRPNYPNNIIGLIIKKYMDRYHRSYEALYNKNIVSPELMEYIKSIEIPDEQKLLLELTGATNNNQLSLSVNSVPVFQQIENICGVLKKYFDIAHHELLRTVLNSGRTNSKLLFTGRANQLADAFKRLYVANLITGCNQQELIKWIMDTFEYKGRTGGRVTFTEKYLHDIISTEQKPCKNNIIEIKKDEQGEVSIISPDRKGRRNT